MDTFKIQSLRILKRTFYGIKSEHINEINILLLRLSTIRHDKVCLSTIFTEEMAKAKNCHQDVQQWMLIYLAVSTLMKKENRQLIKRYTKTDLHIYNPKLFALMVKIEQIDYIHFQNMLDATQ